MSKGRNAANLRILRVLLLSIVLGSASPAHAGFWDFFRKKPSPQQEAEIPHPEDLFKTLSCDAYFNSKNLMSLLRHNHLYYVSRGLSAYTLVFGHKFMHDLIKLKEGELWIDMGAGEARAQVEYLNASSDGSSDALRAERANTLAVSFRRPELTREMRKKLKDLKHPELFQYLDGRLFEQIPIEEFGRADLITDLYGVVSYTAFLSETLNRYFKILKPNGVLHLFIEPDTTTIQVSPDHEVMNLLDWLSTLPGIVVNKTGPDSVRIYKLHDDVTLPELGLVDFTDDIPPRRLFRVK